jgi:FkbH-like protein
MSNPLRDICNNATSLEELRAAVAVLDPMSLSATDVAIVNRAVRRLNAPAAIRIAYAGTHSLEPLPACFKAHAIGLGIGVADFAVPYGQYMQALFAPDGELQAFEPDILFISCALRQIAPKIHDAFSSLSTSELESERDRIIDHMTTVAKLASQRVGATILLGNFPRPAYPALGIADSKAEFSEMEFYATLNLELSRRFKDSDRVHIMDLDRIVGGTRASSSERMFFIAKGLWSDSDVNAISQELLRYVVAATGRTRKCLVVDLDNTLWGGVAGEDGPSGVLVGPDSPPAEAFESFQHAVRSLRSRGIMIAICSKNNAADVEDVFRFREAMPLKLDDFSAREISWDDKGSGIKRLASALNIGIDSLVFVDDNPAERAIVRGSVDGVEVLELPPDPADYANFLRRQVWFEKFRINADDITRLEHYAVQQRRAELLTEAADLGVYLRSLGTEICVRDAKASDIARIHELFNKTNQFNLTTRRYALGDVEQFLAAPEYVLGIVTASDKFGLMGTVGVYLLKLQPDSARLDSFLMSCRALGRGIETAVMNCLKQLFETVPGCNYIDAEFIPTKKNMPAREFLTQQGFELKELAANGAEKYRLYRRGFEVIPCEHLNVIHETDKEPKRA